MKKGFSITELWIWIAPIMVLVALAIWLANEKSPSKNNSVQTGQASIEAWLPCINVYFDTNSSNYYVWGGGAKDGPFDTLEEANICRTNWAQRCADSFREIQNAPKPSGIKIN